jgi:hypothetical protein
MLTKEIRSDTYGFPCNSLERRIIMFTRLSLLGVLVLLFCCPISSDAADSPRGQPFQNLQQQIDELNSRFTPPNISYTLSCVDAFQVTLHLTVIDDNEIAYYAIQQQGGDPPINFITFLEPGLTRADYSLGVDLGTEDREFLLIASDIYGNTSRSLLHIVHDLCLICEPGTICPP